MERTHARHITTHPKALELKEEITAKKSRPAQVIKLDAEISEMEANKNNTRINETKRWFLEKTSDIDKLLSRLTKRQRQKIQINKTDVERRKTITRQ